MGRSEWVALVASENVVKFFKKVGTGKKAQVFIWFPRYGGTYDRILEYMAQHAAFSRADLAF